MSKQLVITKSAKQKLNKPQATFNRLVKKLEKLRRELEQTTLILNEKLDFYGKEIYPLEQEMASLRVDGVKLFYHFYQAPKMLAKKDRKLLLEVMATQLRGIFGAGTAPDDELKEIFALVEGIGYEEAVAEDFAAMKEDMAETFQQLGLEVDLDGFEHDMSEEELMRKMAEMLGDLKEQTETREQTSSPRKKTAKQIAKEERERQAEEVKNRSVASIYKQLARAFHPDLEQDPALKVHKEDLMKQLTLAYEQNDLHTLLKLELEWIQKEEDNLERLSEEKLAIYNQVLKEQVQELEAEVFMLNQHPRYEPLQRLSPFPWAVTQVNLQHTKRELQEALKEIGESTERLKGKDGLAELKIILGIYRRSQARRNQFEFSLEDLFS